MKIIRVIAALFVTLFLISTVAFAAAPTTTISGTITGQTNTSITFKSVYPQVPDGNVADTVYPQQWVSPINSSSVMTAVTLPQNLIVQITAGTAQTCQALTPSTSTSSIATILASCIPLPTPPPTPTPNTNLSLDQLVAARGSYNMQGNTLYNVLLGLNQYVVATLPQTAANGYVAYASDGTPGSSPCTGGSTGSVAFRENGAWVCGGGSGGGVGSVTASAPLTSSGGSNPNIVLTTPLGVQYGGTQCGAPSLFANLPSSPTQGQVCSVTDSSVGCVANTAVTAGGGSTFCQVTWNGSHWMPGGGVTSAASGGVTSVGFTGPLVGFTVSGSPITSSGTISETWKSYTVSTLPGCNGSDIGYALVSDSVNSCTAGNTLTGSGSNTCPVFCNSSSWSIVGTVASGSGGPAQGQTLISGSTAGTATCGQPWQTAAYKEVLCYLNGYENTGGSATAQTYTYPQAFSFTPYFITNSNPLSGTSTTVLTLPYSMVTAFTGWLHLGGY